MPETGYHYDGEVGTTIQVETEKDLTDATVTEIHIQKPDDTEVILSATPQSGNVGLSVLSAVQNLDQAGTWIVQAYAEFATPWEGFGKAVTFEVFNKYQVTD